MKKILSIVLILFLIGAVDVFAKGFSAGGGFSARSSSSFSVRPSSSFSSTRSSSSSLGSSTLRSTTSSSFSTSTARNTYVAPSVSSPSVFSKTGTSSFSINRSGNISSPSQYVRVPTINHIYVSVPGYRPSYYGNTPGSGFSSGLMAGLILDSYTSPYAYYPIFHTSGTYVPVIRSYDDDGYQEALFKWDNGDTIKVSTYQKVDDLTRTEDGLIITVNGKQNTVLHGKQTWLWYYANEVDVKVANNIVSSSYDWSGGGFLLAISIIFLVAILFLVVYFVYDWLQDQEFESKRKNNNTRYKW